MQRLLELTRKEIELTAWSHVESAHEPMDGKEPDAFADDGVDVVADVRGYTLLKGTTPLGNELTVLVNWICYGEKSRHLPGVYIYYPPVPDLAKRPGLTLMEYAVVHDDDGCALSTCELTRVLGSSTWSSKWFTQAIACLPRNPHIVTSQRAPAPRSGANSLSEYES
ncbi:hypothetical protein SADO_13378 [Salinisphaera dokdonensis CL-ES53]|uniref:Uncharacterized protein n=1 Tax=Salinisphaera dokdonensis CL-ES53 TaxID=1304272 RepID=A0ABV2B499_9GAMM